MPAQPVNYTPNGDPFLTSKRCCDSEVSLMYNINTIAITHPALYSKCYPFIGLNLIEAFENCICEGLLEEAYRNG